MYEYFDLLILKKISYLWPKTIVVIIIITIILIRPQPIPSSCRENPSQRVYYVHGADERNFDGYKLYRALYGFTGVIGRRGKSLQGRINFQ